MLQQPQQCSSRARFSLGLDSVRPTAVLSAAGGQAQNIIVAPKLELTFSKGNHPDSKANTSWPSPCLTLPYLTLRQGTLAPGAEQK